MTSDPPGAPLPPGEAEQSSPDARRGTGEVSETRTAAPGVPSGAAQGGLEPGRGGDPPGGPQLRGQEGQPAAGKEGATESPLRAQEFGRGRVRADQPLAGEPPSPEVGYYTKEGGVGAESNGNAPGARGGDPRGSSLRETQERGQLLSRQPGSGRGENEIAMGESAAAGKIRGGGQEELRAQPPSLRGSGFCLRCACGALCRGRSVCLRRAEMQQLARPCPLFGAPVLRQGANQDGQRDTGQGPSGELSVLQLDQEIHFQATVCKKKRSTMKAVCGAFGHSKLVELLDIQNPSA